MKIKKSGSVAGHTWRFFRAGGVDQVRLDSGKDLLNIDTLDQKLWAALACPVDNVHFDNATLKIIDSDGDKRIRANELVAALKWTGALLQNPDELVQCSDRISVDVITDLTDEGKKLREALRSSLKILGKNENGDLTVAELQALKESFTNKPFNGDGIITVDTASDSSLKGIIDEIILMCGALTDRSGNPGIDASKIDEFFCKAQEYLDLKVGSQKDGALWPLKEGTEDAVKILLEVKVKIEDYFARCAIAEYDEHSPGYLNGGENSISSYAGQTLSIYCDQMKALPIALVKPHRFLPISDGLNPAWQKKIAEFNKKVVVPLFGQKEKLSFQEWEHISTIFAPVLSHHELIAGSSIKKIDLKMIEGIVNSSYRRDLLALVEKDKAESVTFESITTIEKLVRFKRDLYPLCKNFINFKDFYTKGTEAIFQAGTLFIDQRSCNLCIKIDDPNKHSLMASMAGTYLVYCECKRKGEPENITIVAAFTNGDSDNLMIGRNGVFYDRNGKDWDASIIKIINNPISLGEAFWLPYKNFVRMIESQVAKRAAEADTQSSSKLSQAAISTVHIDKAKVEPPQPPKKIDIGIVAALGVAAGALGTFIATLFGYMAGIVRLGPLAVIGAAVGLIALISGPSLILAFIKLRKRNLGPILDAGGWAVNAKAKISVPFGTILTHTATLPPGSQRDLFDPYAAKKSVWPKIVGFMLVFYLAYILLDHFGYINRWSNGLIGVKREMAVKDEVSKTTDQNSK
jgi:Ca2+-binding EF-hand superfamily protein